MKRNEKEERDVEESTKYKSKIKQLKNRYIANVKIC